MGAVLPQQPKMCKTGLFIAIVKGGVVEKNQDRANKSRVIREIRGPEPAHAWG